MLTKQIAKQNALEYLRAHDVGVVATIDTEGQPFVSPVYYAAGANFGIFFLTTSGTRKSQNIMNNERVAFSVGSGPEYIAVTIRGKAILAEGNEYDKGLALIKDKAENNSMLNWPIKRLDELKKHQLYLYKIEPKEVTFLNIDSSDEPESIADYLYELLP
ncbi:MAG: pyridoxamine 5'-phosphate oxidase family protein [Patescibacteria group bacterium]